MKKRILSSLLAILMLVSLLPMQVFAAEGEVTRIQWLQKLTETFDMTVEADNYPDNYYSDVSSDDSYYRDVMVATEFGLIDQEPGTELKPNEPATREFAAHTLNFCLGYELEEGATYTFADSASLTYANDAQIAVNRNWFALVDGKFMPEQTVTNGEMTAMLADAAAVLEGQEVDTGAQSEYTFADGVKEIPESASVTTSEDGSSLTIVGYTGTLKAGDIVAVHEVFPVIYSVTAVTSADGVLTLTVTKLDADDYIISMNTQGSVDADLSEVEAAEDTDITYIMSNGVETQSAARAQALLRDKKVKIKDVKLDKTLYNSGGIKVKVYGKLTSMNLTYNVKLGGNSPYAMVRVDGKASVGCSASFDSMESLELPSSITLAYVPVAGIGKIAVSAKVSLEGEVTLEYSTNFTAGFEYSKSSGFRAIKNFSTGSFSVQAQVDLKAGIEANAGLADIPFITGYVYIEAGARMKMYYSTVNSNTVKYCVDTSAYLYAKVGYYIGIKNVKTWSDSYEIWDMSNSPMKVHNHFENGVSTGGVCTVGSDCSNKGYGRNGYTTGANSRYYNYGGSNGSSKGTSSSGKPYTIYEYTLDDYKNAVITKYNGNVSALFVPKTIDGYTVVGIGSSAFKGNTKLRVLHLPETLTSIGQYAFSGCINLGTIEFPESLIEISYGAFYGCNSLTSIKLPSKITRIENNTFYGCSSMTTAELPEALKSIGEYAFYGCEALEGIVIPDKTYLIENDAFENCSALKSLKCGTGLRTVEYNAFRNCDALTEVTLQEGVTTIGNNAFYDCDGLETIAIPNSVTSIGTSLFSGCEKLKNVTLGIGITQIPASMFYQCPKLESIALPYRVTSIGDSAFANSTSFTSITIPRSVTTFGSNIFSYPAKLTIYGVSGTKAETYAGEIGATFVPIDKPATSATLDKTTLTLNKGSNAKLNLSVQPVDFTDEVNWKSANTSVVTVAADGTVKAVGVGTTTIKVTVGNASASCKVTVVQPVTSIYLNTTSLSMEALSTYQLTATAYPNDAYDKSVKWESSDTSVATVSEDGLVMAVGKGTATIKATSTAVSSVSRSCTVTVTNNGIVAKDVAQLESPHNYSNNCSDIWLYTLPDASKITVTFDERTNIEDGFDYLYIYNASGEQVGKYTGTELAGKSIDIDGDTVKIKLVSDGGGNEWGFKVTDVKVASGAHVHSYTSVVTAPSCTEKGYTTHTCTCGDSYVDSYTDALGHSYGAWKQTKAPTCTAKGAESRSCTRCNATETRDINALGHDIKHHAAKTATCTEKGWAAYDTCSRCNYSTYKEIAATGHHHNAVVTAPTCTAKGYTTHTCTACGNSYKDSYTNALGHNYANGKCTRCGAADPNYNPAPAAPELKITTVSGKPKISWNAVDGAVKYWVYRSTDGKTFKYYDSTTKTTYTNNSTTIGTTYYYKVKAVNVVDGKNYASAYSASKSIQCKPAAPTVSINRSNGKPKLSWKTVSGATKYWIYRSTDGVNFKYWDSTTKTSYTNSGAESGKKYYYRVKAVAVVNGKNIVSANSSTKSLFTSLAKPSVSITTSNGKPKLTWKAVTGADKYYIYRSTDGKNFSYWDSTTKTTYVNSGAKKNTKYYYKVKAVCTSNSNANSAQSSTVSIKATK